MGSRSKKPVVKQAAKTKLPTEMNPEELAVYLKSVGDEVDRLIQRRGLALDAQPALASNPQVPGTFLVACVVKLVVKSPS